VEKVILILSAALFKNIPGERCRPLQLHKRNSGAEEELS